MRHNTTTKSVSCSYVAAVVRPFAYLCPGAIISLFAFVYAVILRNLDLFNRVILSYQSLFSCGYHLKQTNSWFLQVANMIAQSMFLKSLYCRHQNETVTHVDTKTPSFPLKLFGFYFSTSKKNKLPVAINITSIAKEVNNTNESQRTNKTLFHLTHLLTQLKAFYFGFIL